MVRTSQPALRLAKRRLNMRAVIHVFAHDFVDKLVADWENEDAAYYGTPGGARAVKEPPVDLVMFLGGRHRQYYFGLAHHDTRYAWLRSSGTWLGVEVTPHDRFLHLSGRRHSLVEWLSRVGGIKPLRWDRENQQILEDSVIVWGQVIAYETSHPEASPFICGIPQK
jgi:hypothetical protein